MINSTFNRVKPSCLTCNVTNCFLKECSNKWKEFADSSKTTTIYKKGMPIIIQDHPIFGIYFISAGKVKVTKSWGGEKEQIVRFAKCGDILGYRGFGSARLKHYPISAFALEETQICFLENETAYQLLKKSVKLSNRFTQFYAEELYKMEIRMNIISQKPVRERVAIALIELRNAFGNETSSCTVINVTISRQELADFVGSTRENISNFISEFRQNKLISTDHSKIEILDMDGLNKISNLNGYNVF